MASKSQAAASARAKAQAEVKAKERRTTTVIIAVALALIAAFGAVVFFIVNSAKVPTLEEMWAQPDPPVPAGSDSSGGIGVGVDGIAGADVPTDAVRVDLYLDFLCPGCRKFEEINAADIDALRASGEIAVYYHPISINDSRSAGSKYPTRSANAAAIVADQAPEHFLAFAEALFADQPEEGVPGHDDATIASIAVGAGVPQEVADSFAGGEFVKWVTAATDQASIDGLAVTPTVMVNGTVLSPEEVPYFEPGALKAYLEALPKPDGTPPAPNEK